MPAGPSTIPVAPLMAGFHGKQLPPQVARRLRDGTLLGVVLFSRNVESPRQVRDLCREVRGAGGRGRPVPLIAVDQEGGRVQRLTEPGFTRFPPARCYSTLRCHAEQAAKAAAEAIAEELHAVGVDINFAPVLDVDSNPDNPVIGNRALSSDPSLAARLGISFFRGTLSRGVIPVGKHFPGHGATDADSHEELPVVRSAGKTLLSRDLLPFRRAIRAGIPALMSAHVLYPALDRIHPATVSPKILTGLLRERLRFRGVLFSDALEMRAVTSRYGIGEAAVRAAAAGCDVPLVCRGEEEREIACEALAREARDNPAFRTRLRAASRRIRRLREILAREGEPDPGRRHASLRQAGSRKHRELASLLSERWEHIAQTSPGDRSGSIGEG